MSNTYIQEAFRQFYLTEDAEEFSLNVSGPDDSASFLDIINSAEDDETISDVYDLEAEAKEDLKQSYIGKVILDCNVCHSNVFFDKADVTEDESGLVCKDIECPYCMSNEGYTIIGEVKPFAEEGSEELEEPIEDTLDKEDILSGDESEEILDDEESIDIDNEVANEDDIDLEDEDDDLDESLTEAFLEGQNVYIKPDKRFGRIKSHIKDDLYEVETYDGEDNNLPDRVDTYYASDLELNESLSLSDVAKLKGKSILRRREGHDGCKRILGRNNTELSGDKDLHESLNESIENELVKGNTYTCVDGLDGKYEYIGKVEYPEFGELFKFKPLDSAAKETTQEMSDEMGLTYDGFAYMTDETVFYTFLDSEDEDEELEEEYLKSSEKLDPSKELSEGAKLDKVKELDGNDSISGEETPIDGTQGEGLKSNDEIRGPKYKEFKEACEKPLKEQQGKVDDREFKICSDKDGEICKVTGEGEAKKTIAEFKKQDKKSGRKGTKYTYQEITNESLSESIEDVSITTDDETMTMSTKEDGGVVVETSPKEEIDTIESDILNGDEMIAPLEPETKAEIEDNIDADDEAEDALEDDLFEEEPIDEMPVDEEPVEDIEDFDNESFDELGESYLRRCYENVNSYETSKISQQADGSYLIEGRIGFDSGNVKNTQFVFNKNTDSQGKLKLEGYNNQISKGKKTFKLNCSVEDKTIVCESLNYNYKGKNDLDESVRVYGTVKRKVK